jgi:hypothetical protein
MSLEQLSNWFSGLVFVGLLIGLAVAFKRASWDRRNSADESEDTSK